MSTVTEPIILNSTGERIASALETIAEGGGGGGGTGKIYGFTINGSESDPRQAVTYIKDAVGMIPAKMNFSSGIFDYGSWENAFFMPKPCMLKSDGTVDYYLKPTDYTKKADGTASDVGNTSYDGNAMMEWGQNGKKIWLKVVPSGNKEGATVFIADHKADEYFHDYAFHNCKGESVAHFYTPIYNGSLINSKMRSLSGQAVSKSLTGTQEKTYAKANNPDTDEMWNIECLADRILINLLLVLISRSLDTKTAFGQGLNTDGTEAINNSFRTGVHNDKGLFYGTNSGAAATYTNAIKIFGMENYYGFQWRRLNGWILNGTQKIKLTYKQEDGSTVDGYNEDGAGYINTGITPTGTSGGYISRMNFGEYGFVPKTVSGTSSTYFCDGHWFNTSVVAFALVGGPSSVAALVGAFCSVLYDAVSYAAWRIGAALSCKPLA